MSVGLEDAFPNLHMGLENIGFFFGAGASHKAGYPLMKTLTTKVIDELEDPDVKLLDKIVEDRAGKDVETISDRIDAILTSLNSNDGRYHEISQLNLHIRDAIIKIFTDVESPILKDHIAFFESLNRIFSGQNTKIWIFTTNYESLFEISASIARIPMYDGFQGTSTRYFDVESLTQDHGKTSRGFFEPNSSPSIRLIKLHGSLNWWENNGRIYSSSNYDFVEEGEKKRIMILPRKNKVMDTLDHPYDSLFSLSSTILGTQCKYLLSCGYSFGDKHINEKLLLPSLRERKIKLTALLKEPLPNIEQFKQFPNFSFGTETTSKKFGLSVQDEGTDIWQFEKLVQELKSLSGV